MCHYAAWIHIIKGKYPSKWLNFSSQICSELCLWSSKALILYINYIFKLECFLGFYIQMHASIQTQVSIVLFFVHKCFGTKANVKMCFSVEFFASMAIRWITRPRSQSNAEDIIYSSDMKCSISTFSRLFTIKAQPSWKMCVMAGTHSYRFSGSHTRIRAAQWPSG